MTLTHHGFLYRDVGEYLAGTLPFITGGLDRDMPVLVAVPQPRLDLLRDELGEAAARVRLVDMREAGRNPHRIIPWVLRAFTEEHADRPVRIVGEPIWPGRAPEEIPGCVQHEALINVAMADTEAEALCAYDADGLHPGVLMYVRRTHPTMLEDGEARVIGGYADPLATVALLNQPLPEPAGPIDEVGFGVGTLGAARALAGAQARAAGLAPERVVDLQLSVNEIATNTVEHGGDGGTVRAWWDGGRVVCEVRGPGEITDWMAGRIRPPDASPRGRGLLLANRLCDLVQTYTSPSSTVTRLHIRA
jgi:anti-sigma regulatory factor (Ser/Thr protein kinase)